MRVCLQSRNHQDSGWCLLFNSCGIGSTLHIGWRWKVQSTGQRVDSSQCSISASNVFPTALYLLNSQVSCRRRIWYPLLPAKCCSLACLPFRRHHQWCCNAKSTLLYCYIPSLLLLSARADTPPHVFLGKTHTPEHHKFGSGRVSKLMGLLFLPLCWARHKLRVDA